MALLPSRSRRHARSAAALLLIVVSLVSGLLVAPPAAQAQSGPNLERLSADNPAWISSAVSQRFFTEADTVVLARDDAYADALAGAPLAAALNAPILLVPQEAPLPQSIFNEIDRLGPTTAIILGGTSGIGQSVADKMSSMGITVDRIGGENRFATAAQVAERVVALTGQTQAYLVLGEHPNRTGGWPDAVAISALAARQGRPILLSNGSGIHRKTRQAIRDLGMTRVELVGGTGSLDDSVADAVSSMGVDVDRIAGSTRFATSLEIADRGINGGDTTVGKLFLVTGGDYADALVTAPAAARSGSTMLMVDGYNWDNSPTRQFILDRYNEIGEIFVVGSGDSVPASIDHELVDLTFPRLAFVQSGGVRIEVGQNIAEVISNHPAGTRFTIAAGVHRGQSFQPRHGDHFIGEAGAVLNGGVVLDPNAAGIDGAGRHTLNTPPTSAEPVDPSVEMIAGHEREALPNELWARHIRLRHVNTLAEVDRPGTWYFDYDSNRAITFDDPRTLPQPLELSVTPEAITTASGGKVRDVLIKNLIVTHYANRPSRGVLDLGDSVNWDVSHVSVLDNHAVGVRAGPGLLLHDSRIVRNGQMGVTGTDTDFAGTRIPVMIQRNEVAMNGELGFFWAWEGGSIKFGRTVGLVVSDNWVHNHPGPGPWMDEFGVGTTFERNLIEHNGLHGLMHEISTGGTITDNLVRHNGVLAYGDGGAGIWVSNSPDVEIAYNIIEGNRLPVSAQSSPPQSGRPEMPIEDLNVHDNDIRIDYILPGLRVTSGRESVYASGNNRFHDNMYRTRLADQYHFWWGDVYSITGWQADLGFDVGGTFRDISEPAHYFGGRPGFGKVAYGAHNG